MGRLRRFEEHRFIGVRDSMVAYDCDDESQCSEVARLIEEKDLLGRDLLQTFGPDTALEAMNRGFRLRHSALG